MKVFRTLPLWPSIKITFKQRITRLTSLSQCVRQPICLMHFFIRRDCSYAYWCFSYVFARCVFLSLYLRGCLYQVSDVVFCALLFLDTIPYTSTVIMDAICLLSWGIVNIDGITRIAFPFRFCYTKKSSRQDLEEIPPALSTSQTRAHIGIFLVGSYKSIQYSG